MAAKAYSYAGSGKSEAAYRRDLRRELERDFRAKQREKIRELRAKVKAAKEKGRQSVKRVVARCKTMRAKDRETIRERRLEARLAINAERDELFGQTREKCELRKSRAKTKHAGPIAAAQEAVADERALARTMRIYGGKKQPAATRAERRAESDSEVEANLSPDMIPVWRRVKKDIKRAPHMTRTEVFEHWTHEDPATVEQIQREETEKGVDVWITEEAEMREAAGQDVSGWGAERLVEEYDQIRHAEGDVPF